MIIEPFKAEKSGGQMDLIAKAAGGVKRRVHRLSDQYRRRRFPKQVQTAWKKVRSESLSYATESQLHQLLDVIQNTAGSNALIIEAGCARGGSAILMCAAKAAKRPMQVYDMFDMIPPPSEHDGAEMTARYEEIVSGQATGIDGGRYYLYEADLEAVVAENFNRFGYPTNQYAVQLIKGDLQDTLAVSQPVALAHIDVDWYEPVGTCLERIVPHLLPGGSVALHAYFDWSGCRNAADHYFESAGRENFEFDVSAGHLLVTRRKDAAA